MMTIALKFIPLLILIITRHRSRRSVKIRSRSTRAFERIQSALTQLGFHAELVQEEDRDTYPLVVADLAWTSSRKSPFLPSLAWNRVCGSRCLEDKRILGEILTASNEQVASDANRHLQSYSVGSLDELVAWWNYPNSKRVWILKDACANGGCGVWFLNRDNPGDLEIAQKVMRQKNEAGFTLQEYLPGKPMLWEGRKFHFRVAAVITASGRAYLHRTAFVHPANKPFTTLDSDLKDPAVHITNLCVNLAQDDPTRFVGEVREDLITERPELWPRMLQLWGRVVTDCFKVMKAQRSPLDFEYVGLDIIANDQGQVYLIEANCPPALSSATGYAHAEAMHDEILFDLFSVLVLPPILQKKRFNQPTLNDFAGWYECPTSVASGDISFTGDYHKAQSTCDLLAMLFLNRRRKARQRSVPRVEGA